jgi:hypothetical protein
MHLSGIEGFSFARSKKGRPRLVTHPYTEPPQPQQPQPEQQIISQTITKQAQPEISRVPIERKKTGGPGSIPPRENPTWITRRIKIPSVNAEIKVTTAPKVNSYGLDTFLDALNRSLGSKGLFGKKDHLVVTRNLLLWFAKSKPTEGKVIDSSGGLLAGIWYIAVDEPYYRVRMANNEDEKNTNPGKNLLLTGSELELKLAGSKISGKYANVNNIKWGIQYSTDAKSTKRSGKTILSIEKGAYSADDGIFIEFTGTLGNSGTAPGIESMTDTDPAVGQIGETQYTLTFRIPAARPEFIQEVEFVTKKGNFGPISSAKVKLQMPAYKDRMLSFATAPEPQVPNKTLDLGKVFINKYFKNSCVKDVYFYDVAPKNHKEKLSARLPPGKGQIACIGGPSPKDNIPFICAYPNNDYIPKETYGEYTLSVVDDRAKNLMHALDYSLISTPTITLSFKEKEKLTLIMRYKLLDAKIDLETKGENLKTIKIR